MSTQTLDAASLVRSGLVAALCPSSTKYDQTGGRVELWSPWAGATRPSTAIEERAFTNRLRELAAAQYDHRPERAIAHSRYDITSIVTALRAGLSADDVLLQAPGLCPATLVAAYDHLEAHRARSEQAWRLIVANPTQRSVDTYGSTAAQLLPVVVSHLNALRMRGRSEGNALAATIHSINHEITRTTVSVELLEETLDDKPRSDPRAQQVGGLLLDQFGEGAWSLSTFLPPRVGTLVSLRVSALLGEGLA